MGSSALTPDLALRYLDELSTDIRAALLLDRDGSIAASSDGREDRSLRLRGLVVELFDRAGEAAGQAVAQVEVSTATGAVFAIQHYDGAVGAGSGKGRKAAARPRWTLAVVCGRFALPSLMFYDLRSVLADLEAKAA